MRSLSRDSMLDLLERLVLYRRPLIVLIHLMLTTVAYFGAFLLRFEFGLLPEQRELFLLTLPLLLIIRMAVFAYWHVHEGLWRYVSMRDILSILRAVTLSSLVFVGATLAAVGHGFPRSVFVLDWLLCLALVGGCASRSGRCARPRGGTATPGGGAARWSLARATRARCSCERSSATRR